MTYIRFCVVYFDRSYLSKADKGHFNLPIKCLYDNAVRKSIQIMFYELVIIRYLYLNIQEILDLTNKRMTMPTKIIHTMYRYKIFFMADNFILSCPYTNLSWLIKTLPLRLSNSRFKLVTLQKQYSKPM